MTAVAVLVPFALFLLLALLGPRFGADSRPGPRDEPPGWMGGRPADSCRPAA